MLRLPMQYFHDPRIGDLISLSSNDVGAVRKVTGRAIQQSLNTVFVFFSTLGMMLTVSPHLTLLACAPLPVVTLVARFFGRSIHQQFKAVQEEFAAIASRCRRRCLGFASSALTVRRASRPGSGSRTEISRAEPQHDRLQSFFHPLLGFLTGLGVVVVLYAGGQQVIAHRMTLAPSSSSTCTWCDSAAPWWRWAGP